LSVYKEKCELRILISIKNLNKRKLDDASMNMHGALLGKMGFREMGGIQEVKEEVKKK
jgi:hypothetical protein